MHPDARTRGFVAEWWDGAALVPSLLVDVDRRRVRAVVGPAGEVALLPRWSWAARRRLERLRRAAGPLPPLPAEVRQRPHVAVTAGGLPRTPLLGELSTERPKPVRAPRREVQPRLRVAPSVDYRACAHIGCGAVVPLPERGVDPPCPRCGRR